MLISRVTNPLRIFFPKVSAPPNPTNITQMPSRSNPNVPTSVKNRARSRKAGLKAAVKARPAVASTDPDRPAIKAGVHHQKTNSSKTVRRIAKRSQYAITRKEAAVEEIRKAGEGGVVEMKGLWTFHVGLGGLGMEIYGICG